MGPCSKSKLLLATLLCCIVRSAAIFAQSEGWQEEERAKQAFLCNWRTANIPASSAWPLPFCEQPNLPIGTALVEFDRWWGRVFENNKIEVGENLRNQFKADWMNSPSRAALLAKRAESERQEEIRRSAAAERQRAEAAAAEETRRIEREKEIAQSERQFSAGVQKMSAEDLCLALHDTDSASARAELNRRKALTSTEWKLIDDTQIAIGLRETALLCSWGRSEVNRTVTAHSVWKQYVYGTTYVYVENGRVTAVQDRK